MHRFFIPPEWIDDNSVVIEGSQVHQILNVLRLRKGDRIAVLDNSGHEYEVTLSAVTKGQVHGVVAGRRLIAEPRARVTVYQAVLKGSRFDFMVQKCTELGVARFVPMLSERCVVRRREVASASKAERWRRIITEAAEQSGRGTLAVLARPVRFEQACQSAKGLSLLPWEGESKLGLREVLREHVHGHESPFEVNLFVGPEGGFSRDEVELAVDSGVLPVTLGRRVLRAETAGLVAATAVFFHCGDLDPVASG